MLSCPWRFCHVRTEVLAVNPSLTRYRPYRPRFPVGMRPLPSSPRPPSAQHAAGSLQQPEPGRFTVGLEEEMFLVDAGTLDCVERMPGAFLADAKAMLGDRVKREIISSMIELVTRPSNDLSAVAAELVSLRASLAATAHAHGLALLACGTHPFSDWRQQTLTAKPRYDLVAGSLGSLSTRIHLCGLHIHVAVPDAEQRISVMNRLQQFLPLFLALSTSSPFWRGAPTGLKSYRSAANDETPRTGLPTRFNDAGEFDRYVDKLTAAGFIPDQTFLWWAIRPSLKYPTLELRISDCCTDWRDAIAIAALYRCLVHALTLDPTICDTWEDHYYLVNLENRWQAIRYGLDATVLDPVTGKVQPMRRCVREMVARLAPGAKALGCNAELRDVLRILEIGTSAERQTVMHEVAVDRGAGPLEAMRLVAAGIANETLAAA